MSSDMTSLETKGHLHFAVACNHRVWALLGEAERTTDEDAELVDAAHASLFHWRYVGTGIHQQRGEWLISHVYATLALGAEALRHAERCLALTATYQAEMEDFDVAYAYLGMARAHAILDNQADAQKYLALVQSAGDAIANEEDRSSFLKDTNSGNWYGLR
jgi:hypothetical protein